MARSGAVRLALVEPDPEPVGDVALTEEAIAGWNAGQRRCRGRKRHQWGPHVVHEHRSFYDVVERCPHCKNRRHADFSKQGRQLTKWKPDYRKVAGGTDYLLPRGAAKVTGELLDQLVLQDILSRRIVEVTDDDEDDDA